MIHNTIYDIQFVEDDPGSVSSVGLNSDHFDTTSGQTSITETTLIGAEILALFRENVPYEEVTGTPGNREFNFDNSTGLISFGAAYTFNPNEKIFIIWNGSGTTITQYEPVTVSEMKIYLRLEGFYLEGESTATVDFDDDDYYIKTLITSARQMVEEYTGWSLIPKVATVLLTNLAGRIELPGPPIGSITSFKDSESTEITDYTIIGNVRKFIKGPCYEDMTIVYNCGYDTPQAWAKDAIMKDVCFRYENRGDNPKDGISHDALQICKKHRIRSWLV